MRTDRTFGGLSKPASSRRLSSLRTRTFCIRQRLLISGQVQGVWFRDSCRRQADALGVRGWARNLDDGRVEVVAQGPPEQVRRLVEWCHHGPSAARVDAVDVSEDEPPGRLHGFEVR